MRTLIKSILLFISAFAPAVAQDSFQAEGLRPTSRDPMMRDFILRQLNNQSDFVKAEEGERRQEQYRQREFVEKANQFVKRWEMLVQEYNRKGAFNVKAAKAASKAFHELERSEGWLNLGGR